MAGGVVGPQGASDRHRAWGFAGVGAGGCCVAGIDRVRWPAPQGVVTAASERAIHRPGLLGSIGASTLPQHKPPHENAADQQHEQHDGDHADHVEQILRLLVRGGLLPVRPLKLLMRLSAG